MSVESIITVPDAYSTPHFSAWSESLLQFLFQGVIEGELGSTLIN
jgi:hypothetical protein